MVIAVDFDGTLCTDAWPNVGEPVYGLFHRLEQAQRAGHKIILWTCRSGEKLKEAVDFCREYGLEFDGVNDRPASDPDLYAAARVDTNYRKVFADLYIDDRSTTPSEFCISFKDFLKRP